MTTKSAARIVTTTDTPSNEHERLATLLQISGALSSTLNAKAAIQEVLETLARRHSVGQSLVVLIDEEGRQLQVEAAHGLSRPSHHIQYTLGDGVIGKVVESGKAVVVPRVSKEPTLALPAPSRDHGDESSFLCVPIGFDRRVVGALGVSLKYKPDRNFDRSKAFFSVAASMIGQALKVQRLVAAQHRRLVNENAHLRQELKERYDFAGIVGNSGPMQRVYEQVAQVARTSTTVLLRGESGTGKELIAHAIHYNSARAKRPFVKVSCGALPDTLIESELFGYEKGAFTGADSFSTKSATCRSRPRSSCCASCRSVNSSASAATKPCAPTCGSSRRRTRTSSARSSRGSSARIFFTASTCSRSSSRRSGSGSRTFCCLPTTSCSGSRPNMAATSAASPLRPSTC
jgi:transcriptional regulator with GAF, ATPase, and Fis domain